MGWCPVGRVGVVAGTARGSAGEVSSTSLDRSHGDPSLYRGRAVGRHDETRPTANSARSSSRSTACWDSSGSNYGGGDVDHGRLTLGRVCRPPGPAVGILLTSAASLPHEAAHLQIP